MKSQDLQNIVLSKYQKGDTNENSSSFKQWNQFSNDEKVICQSVTRETCCYAAHSQGTK